MSEETVLFIAVALTIGGIFLTRAVFSIGTIVKQLKAQTELLTLLAKQSGIQQEQITIARDEVKGTGFDQPKHKTA